MEKSENVGMQTFDSHLFKLYKEGKITKEEALQNSDSPNNLRLKINLNEGRMDDSGHAKSGAAERPGILSLDPIEDDEAGDATAREMPGGISVKNKVTH